MFSEKTGDWNHAILSLVMVPLAAAIFVVIGPYFSASFAIVLAYYFREVAHSGKYSFNAWPMHDRKQTVYLALVAFLIGLGMEIYL